MAEDKKKIEIHLDVYKDHSILHKEDGSQKLFQEGNTSETARQRNSFIRDAFEKGFLENRIENCKVGADIPIKPYHKELIDELIDAVTSEVGRALVGVTVLQCCIKIITPEQDIRLHKSSRSRRDFSWVDGIPMRSIDRQFITPILRRYDLIHLNKDGFMMTRSLAENYPYSKVYKAKIRGARDQWLEIVNEIETSNLDANIALDYVLTLLINQSSKFKLMANRTVDDVNKYVSLNPECKEIVKLIETFINQSDYSARLFEVAIHSLYQALSEYKILEYPLKPLTQMRSANKKHGNIGDIEILEREDSNLIVEAWDAKYGKPYLRDELEEISEKLANHPETKLVGFIVDQKPDLREDIVRRKKEISDLYEIEIYIFSFMEWVNWVFDSTELNREILSRKWLVIFVESLSQKRRKYAPIDEPTFDWVKNLSLILENAIEKKAK